MNSAHQVALVDEMLGFSRTATNMKYRRLKWYNWLVRSTN